MLSKPWRDDMCQGALFNSTGIAGRSAGQGGEQRLDGGGGGCGWWAAAVCEHRPVTGHDEGLNLGPTGAPAGAAVESARGAVA